MNLIRKQNTWFPSLMDEFLNTNWNVTVPDYSNSSPAVNVKENNKYFSLQIAAPGINKADFEISFENKVLLIQVIQDDGNENNDFTRQEFNYSSFKRNFKIPESVELSKISASYINGVLEIKLPKTKEAQPQQKKLIKIK